MSGERLDQWLVQRGYFPTREKARAAIMAGEVLVNGQRVTKAGARIRPDSRVEVLGEGCPYVSRGGLKLEKALRVFGVDPSGRVAIDVGASTGGFTDCLLQHGARLVYAVDVGYGQLAWKLRQDPRVRVLERTNIRYAPPELFPEPPSLAVVDTSFISVTKFLSHLLTLLAPWAELVVLIKPQFEAGREKVGKKGVVRDPAVHEEVLLALLTFFTSLGLGVKGLTHSPLRGPEGNIEFLAYLEKGGRAPSAPGPEEIRQVVTAAHQEE